MRRLLAAAFLALLLVPVVVRAASAHPLGNYTVNRAVAVTIAPDHVAVLYLVDMAEIPAFGEIGVIDVNADGSVSPDEAGDYAAAACARALDNLALRVDASPLGLAVASEPELDLLPGAGGLQTLRLACHFAAASEPADPWRSSTEPTTAMSAGERSPSRRPAASTSAKPTSPTAASRPTSAPIRPAGWSLPRTCGGSCLVPGGPWRSAIAFR